MTQPVPRPGVPQQEADAPSGRGETWLPSLPEWLVRLPPRRRAILALAVAWLACFGGKLVSSGVPFYRDHLVTNIPVRSYVRARLLQGELPQWYPNESLGVPLIGQIALATFHPTTFLLLPFRPAQAEKLAVLLAYAFALAGAYRLARARGASRVGAGAGGFAFAFGGYALGVSSILAYVLSFAALPWVAVGLHQVVHRRRWRDAGLLAFSWAMVFLAGDAISFLLCGLLAVALWLEHRSRRGAVLIAVAGALATGMAAIELLPATVVAADAVRTVGVPSPRLNLHWALHPLRVLELVVPGFVPDAVRNRFVRDLFDDGPALFATTVFAGGTVLVLTGQALASRSREAWTWGSVLLVSLLLALGDRGGLLPLMQRLVSLLTHFRYPERYLAFFWLALAVLTALGLDVLPTRRRPALPFLVCGLVLVAAAVVCSLGQPARWAWALAGRNLEAGSPVATTVDLAWSLGLARTAAFLLLAAVLFRWRRLEPARPALLAGLVAVELVLGNGAHFPLVAESAVTGENAFTEAIRRQPGAPGEVPRLFQTVAPFFPSTPTGPEGPTWVEGMSHLLVSDVAGLHGLSSLDSNLGATSRRHELLLGAPGAIVRLGGFLGARHSVGALDPRVPDAAAVAAVPRLGLVLHAVDAHPRAFLADVEPVADAVAAARWVRDRGTGVLPWESTERRSGTGPVSVSWPAPERVEVDVEASAPAALVVTDELAPGWSATVDGRPVPIVPTAATLRGVAVPGGRHHVSLRYSTPRLRAGIILSLAALVTVLLLVLMRRSGEPARSGLPREVG